MPPAWAVTVMSRLPASAPGLRVALARPELSVLPWSTTSSPELALKVGATSDHTTKGRHTTRVATLHRVGEGYVADTPGIRELGLWELPDEKLDACFVEMRPFLGGCGFRDCRHRSEPDCAIKRAVEEGAISPERYESYRRLLEGDER